jgi:hypothetical protein
MMRATHHTVAIAAAIPDENYRQIWQTKVVSNLLKRAGINERRNAICPRPQPCLGQPRRDRDHVLLRYAGIDESGTSGLAQRFQSLKSQIAGEKHKLRLPAIPHQTSAENIAHATENFAQNGRGVKRAAQMLSEFLCSLAARIRALLRF